MSFSETAAVHVAPTEAMTSESGALINVKTGVLTYTLLEATTADLGTTSVAASISQPLTGALLSQNPVIDLWQQTSNAQQQLQPST